jgi:endonuclease/exonuclease/phosphatase family metal-dependent hydrolase
MADFNTPLEHEFAQNFIRDAGLVNSRDIAEAAGNMINCAGGCSRPGTARHMQVSSAHCIDNIFVTPNMKVLRHETILWNGVEHVSDHSPKYADFILD